MINHADRIRNRGQTDPMLDLMKLFGMFCVVYAHTFLHGLGLMGRGVRSSVYVIQLFIFCSVFSGSSFSTSFFILRRMNGLMWKFSCVSASVSSIRMIGFS